MARSWTRVFSSGVLRSRIRPRPRRRPMFLVSWLSFSQPPRDRELCVREDAIVMLTLSTHFLSSTSKTKNLLFLLTKPQQIIPLLNHATTMSISLSSHAFAGNPIRSRTTKPTSQFSPNPALESLKSRILSGVLDNSLTQFASPDFKVLPFRKGRPLATSGEDEAAGSRWRLRWMGLDECLRFLGELSDDRFVAMMMGSCIGRSIGNVKDEGWCFVELRTLMVATDWDDQSAMGELAIAGHVGVRVRDNGMILWK